MQFFRYAWGSLFEVETPMRIAGRRRYVEDRTVETILSSTIEISKMLSGLMKSLQ